MVALLIWMACGTGETSVITLSASVSSICDWTCREDSVEVPVCNAPTELDDGTLIVWTDRPSSSIDGLLRVHYRDGDTFAGLSTSSSDFMVQQVMRRGEAHVGSAYNVAWPLFTVSMSGDLVVVDESALIDGSESWLLFQTTVKGFDVEERYEVESIDVRSIETRRPSACCMTWGRRSSLLTGLMMCLILALRRKQPV